MGCDNRRWSFPGSKNRWQDFHLSPFHRYSIMARPGADAFEDVMRITQELNDFLEARIRERPHEWLWLHNRWAKQRPARRRVR